VRLGGIAGFIVRRLLLGVLVLALVSLVVFAATQALPGDPARSILGRTATPASLKALRDQLGLGGSVVSQYLSWIGGLLHGDAGNSLAAQEPVSDLLGDKVVNSAFLVFCAGIISIPISVAIGAYAALRRDRTFDVTSSLTTLVFAALPEFVVGVSLVVIFATTVFTGFLPAITIIAPGTRPWDNMTGMVLPTATLVLAVTPYVVRIMPFRSFHGRTPGAAIAGSAWNTVVENSTTRNSPTTNSGSAASASVKMDEVTSKLRSRRSAA
jgi:peptide/nickel transport system permease protein